MRLYRGNKLIHDEDVFGVYNRFMSFLQRDREYSVSDKIVSLAWPGDTLKIYGVSGGGGGHSIKINVVTLYVEY